MIGCWQEGELRAYLDGELPAGDMDRLAAHLETCAGCSGLCSEMEQRAAWVASTISELPAQRLGRARPRPTGNRAVRVLLALAASLALALVLLPKRTAPRAVVAPVPQAAPPVAAAPPVTVKPAIIRRILPRKKVAPSSPKPQLEYFLALDNEPVEAGMVVRVGLDGGRVPADVVVGADGRAHAIRLVSSMAGER